jgi:hypothetical protein
MAEIVSSLRYLFADVIGESGGTPPLPPDGLPEVARPLVIDGIALLVEYQGSGYARLYVDRLRRFVDKPGVDATMLCDIARLMAMRMSYEDPIRVAQLKLAELADGRAQPGVEVRRFRFDELVGALPAKGANPMLAALGKVGWSHRHVSIRFSTKSRRGIRRLKLEAAMRRGRLFSVRYEEERRWVERWLHMISRCLDKQPQSASALVATATMVQGYGDVYRQGLADWHAIIDGLAKPVFDGALPLSDLAAAITEARAAARPDRRQAALKRAIAQIRARALGAAADTAAR